MKRARPAIGQTPQAHRIQFVSRNPPTAGEDGSGTYALDLLRYLRDTGFQIGYTLVRSLPLDIDGRYYLSRDLSGVIRLSAAGCAHWGRVFFARPASRLSWIAPVLNLNYRQESGVVRQLHRLWRSRRRPVPAAAMTVDTNAVPAFDTLPTPAERDYFRQEYLRLRPSVVIADYAWMAPIFDEMPPGPALKVIMTHDVLHERVMTFARHGIESGHAAWTWDSERALLRKAQVLLAVQDTEAEVVQAMAPEADVISTPYAVRPRPVTALPVPGRCLFVGSHSPHNVQGLFWFLTEAWPGILRACPHVSLHACGSVCDGIVDSYANVQKLGRVEDLAAEYGSAEVCLVPLQVGSGLKIKLVEALAYGRPSVATSIGLQGLRQFAGRAVVEADTAADFGEAVIALLTDPERRRQLEQEARVLAATWLSPERCYQPFVNRIRWHNEHGLGSN